MHRKLLGLPCTRVGVELVTVVIVVKIETVATVVANQLSNKVTLSYFSLYIFVCLLLQSTSGFKIQQPDSEKCSALTSMLCFKISYYHTGVKHQKIESNT